MSDKSSNQSDSSFSEDLSDDYKSVAIELKMLKLEIKKQEFAYQKFQQKLEQQDFVTKPEFQQKLTLLAKLI